MRNSGSRLFVTTVAIFTICNTAPLNAGGMCAVPQGYSSSSYMQDSDGDGSSDIAEMRAGTDHTEADGNNDNDRDGLKNSEEIARGLDPNHADTDRDGVSDGYEVSNGMNPLKHDSNEDLDGDGISNRDEYVQNTKANNQDTDGDGIPDGEDSTPAGQMEDPWLIAVWGLILG